MGSSNVEQGSGRSSRRDTRGKRFDCTLAAIDIVATATVTAEHHVDLSRSASRHAVSREDIVGTNMLIAMYQQQG